MNKNCLFIGSKQLGLSALKTIYNINSKSLLGCITINDKTDSRSNLNEILNFCDINNIKSEVLEKPRQLKQFIEKYKPDFCLVVGWYWIIDSELLKMCKDGFIGIHASLLPKYRGFAPLVWAMINGEVETGISMFYFDENMDEGDLIAQEKIQILKEDYICNILDKADNATIKLIKQSYELILKGKSNRYKQSEDEICYCSQRKPENGRIEWNNNKEYLYNFIRAQSKPYPGAFLYDCTGKEVKVYRANIFKHPYYGIPGQIVKIEKDKVEICCKNGVIIITPELNEEEIKCRFKFGQILK